ncbi:DUF1553 domain-containing protein [Rosistilla carotiformis]|uniref:DUF1553 domain-containing protein n=1 Tax=Rosistilla carotiformis TaxID=2528017 RepID=UPI001E5DAF6F|nr:DUF1553 domain-containing protein [Rosistilla carotiformis]
MLTKDRIAFGWSLAAAVGLSFAAASARADDNFFENRVAPLLSQRCLSCHAGDSAKGGFSIAESDTFFADGFVEPGESAASHLIALITPQGSKAEMPKDADPLSSEEIATIAEWIDAGAQWPKGFVLQEALVDDFNWWSFQPLARPPIPPQSDPWAKSPIDQFVLEKLREKGLTHSPPADRRTLIRRLTYDLTGLPPTPAEVAQFVADPDPNAYENLVDRLLDSKHYGERWARHWLDVAKYADSNGYDKDKLRPNAWPYRDYVIRSFNEDKPYTRFVQEQIAGDVLFPGTADGMLGLGFIAAGPWDFIGHVEVSEAKLDGKVARNLDRDDMVSGVLNTFCSVTVQCARCHNHKFDPITQQQYYGLQAVFAAVDRADRTFDSEPQVAQQRVQLQRQLADARSLQKSVDDAIVAAGGSELAELSQKIETLNKRSKPIKVDEHGYHSAIVANQDSEKWVEVELPEEVTASQIVLHACEDDFNKIGAGFGFPKRFKLEAADDAGNWTTIHDATAGDFPNPGLMPVAYAIANQPVRRVRITATRLAERKSDFIFALAELEVFAGNQNVATGATVQSLDSIEAPIRWRRQNLTDGKWPRMEDPDVPRQIQEATVKRDAILAAVTTPELVTRREDATRKIAKAEAALAALPPQQIVYAAATDFQPQGNFKPTGGKPREVFVLHRGEVALPGDPAVPGVIPLASDSQWQFDPTLSESERRAQLAAWLTDPEHPLVWRSIVNRIWQYHFGQGIVATPNDFGRMGAEPTHPELLDWLAVEFRDGGQSMKTMHRMIVTSNTYQQASDDIVANSTVDGSNQYLWRSNRRRLSAEEVRDSILSVSGSLDETMGGPGFYLFALEKTAHSPHFEYHKFDPADKRSHRRSIYRFIARSQPNPFLTTLDCADSSQSTPRRNETLTSLQALSLLNNKFNLVMSQAFAKRLETESGTLPEQVTLAMQLLAQRSPTAEEREDLVEYAKTHGLQNLCRILLNLSEFVFVD